MTMSVVMMTVVVVDRPSSVVFGVVDWSGCFMLGLFRDVERGAKDLMRGSGLQKKKKGKS